MLVAVVAAVLAAMFIVGLTDTSRPTKQAATRARVSDSPARRRERCEIAYMDGFSAERLDDALSDIRRLIPLVEQAQMDPDPADRFYRLRSDDAMRRMSGLDNELGSAIRDYERAVERRANFRALVAA